MKIPVVLGSALALMTVNAIAQEAPASAHQFSVTAIAVSDYVFKGMTQTWGRPALQGSLDYSHASGVYASAWASTLSQKVVAGANTEIDLSAGYKGAIDDAWGYGFGLLSVIYPGGNYQKVHYASLPDQKYDFTEASVSVNYKWLSLKYSQTLSDLLGFNERTGYTKSSKGSNYVDLSADVPLDDGYSLGLHVGHQNVVAQLITPTAGGSTNPDFTDYRIALSKGFDGAWLASIALTWNDNTAFYNDSPSNDNLSDTQDVGKPRVVLSISKTF